jgi:hypothetical protein
VTLTFPDTLSSASYEDLKDNLDLFLRKAKRQPQMTRPPTKAASKGWQRMSDFKAVFEVEAATAAVLAGWAGEEGITCSYNECSRILSFIPIRGAARSESDICLS